MQLDLCHLWTGRVVFSNFLSAYLSVPLRLCGKWALTTCLPQKRRGTERYAEKIRNHRGTLILEETIVRWQTSDYDEQRNRSRLASTDSRRRLTPGYCTGAGVHSCCPTGF